jgi:ketosteroid isomerase-like protein
MPGESVEVVRRQFEALARGGADAASAFWHPDVDWRAVEGAADDIGVMRGADALRRYYQDWFETFEDLRASVGEVLYEEGGRVAVSVHNTGRGRASGVVTRGRYFVACVVREGRIVRGREYESGEQAAEAARSPGFTARAASPGSPS